MLNASKLVLGFGTGEADPAAVTEPLDRAMLAALAEVVATATAAFEAYEHTRALEVTETFFWTFCDDYVELVKNRAYGDGPGADSARSALRLALDTVLRLLAPVLPFATEEVWSWYHDDSIHVAPWPDGADLRTAGGDADPALLDVAGRALSALRKVKTAAKVKMRTEIVRTDLVVPAIEVAGVEAARADVMAAGRVTEMAVVAGDVEAPVAQNVELGEA